jgi:hypothetical protein
VVAAWLLLIILNLLALPGYFDVSPARSRLASRSAGAGEIGAGLRPRLRFVCALAFPRSRLLRSVVRFMVIDWNCSIVVMGLTTEEREGRLQARNFSEFAAASSGCLGSAHCYENITHSNLIAGWACSSP